MTDKLKQIIKEEVAKLPKENQEVINAFGWENISEEIGKRTLLDESEVNDFQVQTLLVLIGLADPNEYERNIENEVGTSKIEAGKIAEEVFEKIFIPINEALLEKIKNSEKVKNPNFGQTLDFILSGGDYSAFIKEGTRPVTPTHPVNTNSSGVPQKPDTGKIKLVI